jgi:hypothetical protein
MAKSRQKDNVLDRDRGEDANIGEREGSNPDVPEAAPQFAGDTTAGETDRDRVARRAYELYLARGAEDGRDMDDWLVAERELTGPRGSSGE